MTEAFVVESAVMQDGKRLGTARVYVATEARAQEIVSQGPGRTYRELSVNDLPAAAREGLERAAKAG